MRNLKRALSLTLASVMLLGMMVVGSSAAAGYSDVDENDNVEAIEVLQTIEVMVGDDRGFGPDRPVTRNEMAVVMGKLLNLNYNYYASSCPFTDVAEWARGWVGACYANGIVSGRGDGIYDGEATVTAIEAASMMMRALGYFKYAEDYADGFQLVTVRQGSEIGIFNMVGTDGNTPMTRNQVAQMALNALRSNMVTFTGTPGIEVNGVKVGYKAEYTPRTGTDNKYDAIEGMTTTIGGDNSQFYIQLGEQLYDGDLVLRTTLDDFGRPARYWEYDGKEIGTYAKKEMLKAEYTEKVTGKTLYDLLGSSTLNGPNYTLVVSIDGNINNDPDAFAKGALTRTNTDTLGKTGNGVLTQVYVDTQNHYIYVSIINTYLAIANDDYNEKKDEVSLKVYDLMKSGNLYRKNPVKNLDTDDVTLKASGEDFDVENVKKDDKFLVTVAAGEIKSVVAPEVLSAQTITSHKVDKYVVADKQYDYATTAEYDMEVMDNFGSDDMKEVTYDIVLDKYGYLIGVEKNEDADQYVFLTGVDDEFSHLSQKNVPANVIFMDGTMKTVTINARKSVLRYDAQGKTADTSDGHSDDVWISETANTPGTVRKPSQANMWCTYSVDSDGVYTLKAVAGKTDSTAKVKVAQSSMDADTIVTPVADQVKINSKNISLNGSTDFTRVHGNANTVYINTTALENVDVTSSNKRMIIDDVDTVTTGVANVDMTVTNIANSGSYVAPTDEIYTLYNDKGVILAVVTLDAEDNATVTHYAYINSEKIDHRDYDASAKEYSWYREAVVDGEIVMLKEVSDSSSSTYLDYNSSTGVGMKQGEWYEIKYNADGEVKGFYQVDYAANANTKPNDSESGDPKDPTTNPTKQVGTPDIPGVQYSLNNGWDKTLILQADFTGDGNDVELKFSGNMLYTGNDVNKGVYVASDAKVIVFVEDYDDYEEFTGSDMGTALNYLVDKDNFSGYVNAVVNDNGIATVVVLDEKTTPAADPMTVTIHRRGSDGVDLGDVTVNWNGGAAITSSTTTTAGTAVNYGITGYSEPSPANSYATSNFVANGSGSTTFNYVKDETPAGTPKGIRVQFQTDDPAAGSSNKVGKPVSVVVNLDVAGYHELVAADLTDYIPTGYKLTSTFKAGNGSNAETYDVTTSTTATNIFYVQVELRTDIDSIEAIIPTTLTAGVPVKHGANASQIKTDVDAAGVTFKVKFKTGTDEAEMTIEGDDTHLVYSGTTTADGNVTATYHTNNGDPSDVTKATTVAFKRYADLSVVGNWSAGAGITGDWQLKSVALDVADSKVQAGDVIKVVIEQQVAGAFVADDFTALMTGKTAKVTSPTGFTVKADPAVAAALTKNGAAAAAPDPAVAAEITFTFTVDTITGDAVSGTVDISA